MRIDNLSRAFAVCTITSACTTLPVDIGDKGTTGEGGNANTGGKFNVSGGDGGGRGGALPEQGGAGKGVLGSGGSGVTPAGSGGSGVTPAGSGGTGATGGTPPDSGGAGNGLTPQGGTGGALIDSSTAGKNQGGSGGLSSCNFPTGPRTTLEPPRRTLTWRFEAASAGSAGGEGGESGTGSLDSSCSVVSQGLKDDRCQGTALLRENAGLAEVIFGDGNKLIWDPSGAAEWVSPPFVTRAAGDAVWVDYMDHEDVACGSCGTYTTRKLVIRDSVDGPVRFMAREGLRLDDLSAAEVEDVFGVPATRTALCSTGWTDTCVAATRVEFEHSVLGQVVPPASFTTIAVPNGEFAVFWTASEETTQGVSGCLDGPGLASDTGFAASRITL